MAASDENVEFLWSACHTLVGKAPTVARLLMSAIPHQAIDGSRSDGDPGCCCPKCSSLLLPGLCTIRILSRRRLFRRRRGRMKHGLSEHCGTKSNKYLSVHCRICRNTFHWACCKPTRRSSTATPQHQSGRKQRAGRSILKQKLKQTLTTPTTSCSPSLQEFLQSSLQ